MKTLPVGDCVWEIPPSEKPGMLVPARIYASDALLARMDEGVFEQVTNVACLPGIVRASLCMPDGHWGYGFPIGGVAAYEPHRGRGPAEAHRARRRALRRRPVGCGVQGVRAPLERRVRRGHAR